MPTITRRSRATRRSKPARPSPPLHPVERYIRDVCSGHLPVNQLVRCAVERHVRDLREGAQRGLWFDEARAQAAIRFFAYLKHSKGEYAGKPFELQPWQQFILWNLFGWRRADSTRRFRIAYIELPRKNGKALHVDTPIATPTGWKRHGDLRPGDFVFGPDGLPKKVIAVTEPYVGPTYRLTFSDHCQIVAHARHEWETRRTWYTGRAQGSRRPMPLVDTEQIASTLRCGARGDYTHGITVARPLQLPPVDLPIPPYTLGAWLGDGNSDGARITCADPHIVERIASEGITVKQLSGRLEYSLHGISRAKLAALNLVNNKHVPLLYLRASESQRRALLAGIMDTDGHVTRRGQCEIVLTHQPLFDGVVELIATLGYKPTHHVDVATLHGRVIGPRYRVQFWARPGDAVVSLPRKAERLKAQGAIRARSATRMITGAEFAGHNLVNCIQVEGGFYLAGQSMITTHNSTFAAGIGLKLAFADGEPGAEVYSAATKRDQAIIVHGEATRMVRSSPALASKIQIFRNNLSRIEYAQKYEPLGADEDTLDGLNVHGAIIDELHAHKTRGIFDLIETGTSARRQPMLVCITTAGTDQTEASVCWEQHVYAEQVVRGVIQDDTYFSYIACADDQDDWRDERTWYKCNPNLGVSKKLEYLREQARKAAQLPAKLNAFLRLELNRWTQQVTRWIDMETWDANAGPAINESDLVGLPCYGGLDLSSVSDLTAWVLLFPDPQQPERLIVLPRLWCPESRLQRQDAERDTDLPGGGRRIHRYADQYQAWARDGWLRVTPGNAIDYEAVKAAILEDAQRFAIRSIAVDRLFQGYQLSMELQSEGLDVVACGMGFLSMAGPCAEFERRLLARHFRHGGHPVLRWMANNVAVKHDPAGNRKPDKASSQGKIDGIVAMLLALDRVMRTTESEYTSVYETRGVLGI